MEGFYKRDKNKIPHRINNIVHKVHFTTHEQYILMINKCTVQSHQYPRKIAIIIVAYPLPSECRSLTFYMVVKKNIGLENAPLIEVDQEFQLIVLANCHLNFLYNF